jgi:hypothetical protein
MQEPVTAADLHNRVQLEYVKHDKELRVNSSFASCDGNPTSHLLHPLTYAKEEPDMGKYHDTEDQQD